MDKDAITEFLLENGLSDVDVVKEGENYVTMSFFYDFDKDEIDAARSYATEEGDYDESSIEWYSEFFLPYLTDIGLIRLNTAVPEYPFFSALFQYCS